MIKLIIIKKRLVHSPFALSSAVITSSSKAMLMSSSTKLLNVSFMVLVLSNRDANGTEGSNSKRRFGGDQS